MISIKTILPLLLFLFIGCSGDDDSANPLGQLPPATQTGANTFGCLINGEPFTPKGRLFGQVPKGARYQYVYSPMNDTGHYDFQVFGTNFRDEPLTDITINLKFDNFEDFDEGVYQLSLYENGGEGSFYLGNLGSFLTDMNHTGTITITKYDYGNGIVSGTFEFEVNVNGEVYHITDGRFDMRFTFLVNEFISQSSIIASSP